jgi:WD40 repeat protein
VIVWNRVTGREVFRIEENVKSAPAIAISAEAKLLAIGSDDGTIRLHDIAGGKILERVASDQKSRITTAAFSPDGRWLAWGGAGKNLIVWNARTRQRQCISDESHKGSLTALRFAVDGRTLASTDYAGMTIIWNTESCQENSSQDTSGGGSFAAVSADLSRMAATDAGFPEVQVANLVDRSARKLEIPNSDFLLAIDFHPGREFLALGTRDATVLFWDPDTGKTRQTLRGHRADVMSVVFDLSGQWLASGSINGEVILWDLSSARPMEATRILAQPSVANLFFSTYKRRYTQ